MKHSRKQFRRLLRALPLLALVLCLALADLAPAASAVTQADIDALKGDAKDLAKEKKTSRPRSTSCPLTSAPPWSASGSWTARSA